MKSSHLSEEDRDQWAVYISMDTGTIAEIDFSKYEEFEVEKSKKLIPDLINSLKNIPVKDIPDTYYQFLREEAKRKRSKDSKSKEFTDIFIAPRQQEELTYEHLLEIAQVRINQSKFLTALERQMHYLKLKEHDVVKKKEGDTMFNEIGVRIIAFRATIKQKLFGRP